MGKNFRSLFFSLCCLFFASQALAESLNAIVAVVNENVILNSELDTMVDSIKQQLRSNKTQMPPESVLRQQVLERLVIERIQLQIAAQNGVKVDDEQLNATIRNIAKQSNFSLAEFRNVLQKDGIDFTEFRENIRNQIIISRLRQIQVDNRINITPQEIDNFMKAQEASGETQDEYLLGHILIALPEGATPDLIQTKNRKAEEVLASLRGGADFKSTAVSVSDGQQALEGGLLGWRKQSQIPNLFSESLAKLKVGDVSEVIRSPSGFHIIKLLDQRGKGQRMTSQTLVRHILLTPNEVMTQEQVVARLKDLKARIEHGEDFGKLARSNSQDSISAAEGGNLGWTNPGSMVPEFEAVMNETKKGSLSEPFQSKFGWHLLQVMDRRFHDSSSEFNRAQATDALRKRKIDESLQLWLRQIRDEAYVEYRLNP